MRKAFTLLQAIIQGAVLGVSSPLGAIQVVVPGFGLVFLVLFRLYRMELWEYLLPWDGVYFILWLLGYIVYGWVSALLLSFLSLRAALCAFRFARFTWYRGEIAPLPHSSDGYRASVTRVVRQQEEDLAIQLIQWPELSEGEPSDVLHRDGFRAMIKRMYHRRSRADDAVGVKPSRLGQALGRVQEQGETSSG